MSPHGPSDFLMPDYLSQVQEEETLGQYELVEHGFEGNHSSVQMPVISQVSSTQNCESSTFPLDPLSLKDENVSEEPKTNGSNSSPDGSEEENAHIKELASITIEWLSLPNCPTRSPFQSKALTLESAWDCPSLASTTRIRCLNFANK